MQTHDSGGGARGSVSFVAFYLCYDNYNTYLVCGQWLGLGIFYSGLLDGEHQVLALGKLLFYAPYPHCNSRQFIIVSRLPSVSIIRVGFKTSLHSAERI